MTRGTLAAIAALAAGCGHVNPAADAMPDTAPDMALPACDPSKPFGMAAEVPGLHNDPLATDVHATLTDDELTVYFATNRMDHGQVMHIYTATRSTPSGTFSMPMLAGPTFSDQGESHPSVSPDGNTLYFDSFRIMAGTIHIFTTHRSNPGVVFPMPSMIDEPFVIDPGITDDGNVLYVANLSSGLLERMTRSGTTFVNPETVSIPVQNSTVSPVTRDELTLFFSLGDTVGNDIYVATRGSTSAPWVASEIKELVTTTTLAEPSWISKDGCRLYLSYAMTGSGGKSTLYVATRPR